MRLWVLAVGLLLASPLPAAAFTCAPTGCTFTISYTEPSTNTAGGPPQLMNTTAFYTVGSGAEKSVVTPATSAAGGQIITKTITEPILPGQSVQIKSTAIGTNAAGASVRSPQATLTIDRSGEVPPTAPTGVTIQ